MRVQRLACPEGPGTGVLRKSLAAPGASGTAGSGLSGTFFASTGVLAGSAALKASGVLGNFSSLAAGVVCGCGAVPLDAYQAAVKAARSSPEKPAAMETVTSAHSRQAAVVPEMKMPQPSSSELRGEPAVRFSARWPRRLPFGSARWRPTAHTALPRPTQPLQSM